MNMTLPVSGALPSLVCIHGFLGQSSDWDESLPESISSLKVDLFSSRSEKNFSNYSLDGLAKWINQEAQKTSPPRFLLGYSLGGRIALHALRESPNLWAGAILISTHPGLTHSEEKRARIQSDEIWSLRFENEDWNLVNSEWNSQPVFANGTREPRRDKTSFSTRALAQTLKASSLGRQEDFRPWLRKTQIPIFWIAGENDRKFVQIAHELQNSRIQTHFISNSGHRVLFDQPDSLKSLIRSICTNGILPENV